MSEEVPPAVLELLNRINDKLDGILDKLDVADMRLAKIEEFIGELVSPGAGRPGGADDILRRLDAIERHLGLAQGRANQRQPKPGMH